MLQALRLLMGAAPEDRRKLGAAALAAIEAGDDAGVDEVAQRIAAAQARGTAHELAAEARAAREAEAAAIAADADRTARWTKITAALAERSAAAADAEKAIEDLAESWDRVKTASVEIARAARPGEVDLDASMLRSFDLEAALRGALSRHSATLGIHFTWMPGAPTPPGVDERIARANAETLARKKP